MKIRYLQKSGEIDWLSLETPMVGAEGKIVTFDIFSQAKIIILPASTTNLDSKHNIRYKRDKETVCKL